MAAAEAGRLEAAKLLLDRGADINARNLNGQTALMHASFNGYPEMVQLLLEKGADVNATAESGATAWDHASSVGQVRIVEILEAYGAISRTVREERWQLNRQLLKAAGNGDLEKVRSVLDRGADFDVETADGRTALKIAKEKGHKAVVELLKARGAKE